MLTIFKKQKWTENIKPDRNLVVNKRCLFKWFQLDIEQKNDMPQDSWMKNCTISKAEYLLWFALSARVLHAEWMKIDTSLVHHECRALVFQKGKLNYRDNQQHQDKQKTALILLHEKCKFLSPWLEEPIFCATDVLF